MDSEKYYKKYLKYKSKYYYLKYGGAGADENPLKYPEFPPSDREDLIQEMKVYKFIFESEANKAYAKGEDILEPGQPFGKDPNRFKTEFLKKVQGLIDSMERASSGYAAQTNEALKKDPNHKY